MDLLCLGSEGYIGSRLTASLRQDGYSLATVDFQRYGGRADYCQDYRHLGAGVVREFDVIILLAGHSSVALCENDPSGSWENNVENFRKLLNKLSKNQLLIYTSSGSVLQGGSTNFGEEVPFCRPLNHYDMQKQTIELLATQSGKKTIGLRFGTVCGWSPNPRTELMINSMWANAFFNKKIQVSNGDKFRPILGLNDLTRAFKSILSHPSPAEGVYNVCSFEYSIKQTAERVQSLVPGTELEILPDSKTYDFRMFTNKFQNSFDFYPQDTIQSICKELELQSGAWDTVKYNRNKNLFTYA